MIEGLCASRVGDRALLMHPACCGTLAMDYMQSIPRKPQVPLVFDADEWNILRFQVQRALDWDATHRGVFLRNYCNTDGGYYWVYRTVSGKTVCISRWHAGIGYASAVRPPSCSQAEAAAEVEAADTAGHLADVGGCVRPDHYGTYYYAI